ncbi:hypothetical protein BpHYR1_024790 [Brachionus plicatilis]|uniref:Uncharacterized protein n=1 Tax=Brachionus plicatilis TaxID=10195 RepID=A0A3M7PWW6_BRAPC|nr:hypothetical protein BpHYR1_024790 [Brachionus plicatilis]
MIVQIGERPRRTLVDLVFEVAKFLLEHFKFVLNDEHFFFVLDELIVVVGVELGAAVRRYVVLVADDKVGENTFFSVSGGTIGARQLQIETPIGRVESPVARVRLVFVRVTDKIFWRVELATSVALDAGRVVSRIHIEMFYRSIRGTRAEWLACERRATRTWSWAACPATLFPTDSSPLDRRTVAPSLFG